MDTKPMPPEIDCQSVVVGFAKGGDDVEIRTPEGDVVLVISRGEASNLAQQLARHAVRRIQR